MSTSLVAVFIPILMMGGIVGRLFREFAVTLSVAIGVSLAGVADHDADDVREVPALGRQRKARPPLSRQRKGFRWTARSCYESCSRLGLAPPAAYAAGHHRDAVLERLSLHHGSQGILSAAGYRPHDGLGAGRPGHFVPGDEARR